LTARGAADTLRGVKNLKVVAIGALVLACVLVALWMRGGDNATPIDDATPAVAPAVTTKVAQAKQPSVVASVQTPGVFDAGDFGEEPDFGVFNQPLARQPYPVDLKALEKKLPGNVYFSDYAPTEDVKEQKRRAEKQFEWNKLFGKIESNEATPEEIESYYAHLTQVSKDHLAFAETVLTTYGDKLEERDRGLLEYGVVLHSQKLVEIAKAKADAERRRIEQLDRQRRWQAGEVR
jgi:hypothetical protein